MVWVVQTLSGDTRLISLSDAEVAIIAECAVSIDSTLEVMGIEVNWNREDPFPGIWVATMYNGR